MNQLLLSILLSGFTFASFSQGFPGRRTMDNNGLKSKVDYPVINGANAGSAMKYGFAMPSTIATIERKWDVTYSVQNVTQDGCRSDFSNVITNNTILANEGPPKKIVLLSNPVGEVLAVSIREDDNFEALEIFNSTGVFQMNSKTQEVNVKSLSSGVYVLKVKTDNGAYSTKMVKL
jgi:hypothetical protein